MQGMESHRTNSSNLNTSTDLPNHMENNPHLTTMGLPTHPLNLIVPKDQFTRYGSLADRSVRLLQPIQDANQDNQHNEHYVSLRARANEEGDQMAKCFEQSHAAYNSGDGALAKELSNKGKAHQRQMEQLHGEASDWIFRGMFLIAGILERLVELYLPLL